MKFGLVENNTFLQDFDQKDPYQHSKIVIGFTYIPKTETLNTKEKEKAAIKECKGKKKTKTIGKRAIKKEDRKKEK